MSGSAIIALPALSAQKKLELKEIRIQQQIMHLAKALKPDRTGSQKVYDNAKSKDNR